MKDQQAIKKLQLLKTIHPQKSALQKIKQDVYQQVGIENRTQIPLSIQERFSYSLINSYGVVFYGAAVVFLLIIFLSASTLLLPNQTHSAILYGKLTLASNQYEKAQIALLDTTNKFADKKLTQKNAQDLSQSLALANTELDALKLKGETGKYTAKECHQVYTEYLSFLENEERNIPANSPSFSLLSFQINSYEEQAEKKLHMYKSL